jgi:hypothetical protein
MEAGGFQNVVFVLEYCDKGKYFLNVGDITNALTVLVKEKKMTMLFL